MNNRKNTQFYDGVPVTAFLENKGYDLKSNIGSYIYRIMVVQGLNYEDALWKWVEYVYPSPKKIPQNKFVKGYQDGQFWYSNERDYIESIVHCSYSTYKQRVKKGISHQDALSYKYELNTGSYTLNGKSVGLDRYCEYRNVSSARIQTIMRKKNISIEEAIKVPVQRIIKHSINNVVKRNSDWAKHYGISPKNFNKHVGKKGFKKALEYFGVDTSDMEIYPCDGDVIMYHDKRYVNQK